MRLTLTDNDGVVIAEWTIGREVEIDIEDLDAEPEHDFYTEENYSGEESVGEEVWREVLLARKNGYE